MMGQIRERTGHTREHILWGEPWILLLMEAADAVKYVKGERPVPVVESSEEVAAILGDRIKKVTK